MRILLILIVIAAVLVVVQAQRHHCKYDGTLINCVLGKSGGETPAPAAGGETPAPAPAPETPAPAAPARRSSPNASVANERLHRDRRALTGAPAPVALRA